MTARYVPNPAGHQFLGDDNMKKAAIKLRGILNCRPYRLAAPRSVLVRDLLIGFRIYCLGS